MPDSHPPYPTHTPPKHTHFTRTLLPIGAHAQQSHNLLHKVVRLVGVFLEAFRLLLHALLDLENGRRFGGVLQGESTGLVLLIAFLASIFWF